MKITTTGKFIGPNRIWLADRDVPGLAMSRSIGDYKAHTVGVIAEPKVTEYNVQPGDQILVIASDGVFEFMENREVAAIVSEYYEKDQAEKAANAVVTRATLLWKQHEDVIDDITCVVVFFNKKLNTTKTRMSKLEDILTEENIIWEQNESPRTSTKRLSPKKDRSY